MRAALALSILATSLLAGDSGLVEAAKEQDAARLSSLLKQHADVNTKGGDGATALHWAAHWNDTKSADLLIAAGADVNTADSTGITPLHLACLNGSATMVARLLNAARKSQRCDIHGRDPADDCCSFGRRRRDQAFSRPRSER